MTLYFGNGIGVFLQDSNNVQGHPILEDNFLNRDISVFSKDRFLLGIT